MKETHRTLDQNWAIGAGVLLVALLISPNSAAAQNELTIEEMLEKLWTIDPKVLERYPGGSPSECFAAGKVKPEIESFWELLKGVKKEKQKQQFTGSASLGLTGNEVPQKETTPVAEPGTTVKRQASDQYKVNMGIDLRRGFYPGRFEFKSSVDVRVEDGKFSEDVSALRLAYDYYTAPWLQVFGFGSRYSDSFMDIDQRYEIGTGIVLDTHFGGYFEGGGSKREDRRKSAKQEHEAIFGSTSELNWNHRRDQMIAWVDKSGRRPVWFECLKKVEPVTAASIDLEELWEQLHEMWATRNEAEHKREAKWRLALLLGGVLELEQATLDRTTTTRLEAPSGESGVFTRTQVETFSLDAEEKWRFVLRPTIEIRSSPRWVFQGELYWKPAFANSHVVELGADGAPKLREVKDTRVDSEASATFKVSDTVLGQPGDISLELKLVNYHDEAPATYTKFDEDEPTLLIDGFSAPDNHRVITFKVKVSWK